MIASLNPAAEVHDLSHPHVNVLGVQVSAINMAAALDLADRCILNGQRGYVCLTGVHGVMEAFADPKLRRILNCSMLNAPDGMPMTWVGRMQGQRNMDRVFGPDFMLEMCRLSVERRYRHYFYGGPAGVAEALHACLAAKIEGLKVVGTFTPPFRDLDAQEEREFMLDLQRTQPDILWVGLSTPRQERFMAHYFDRLQVPLLIGVGAAFDYHTGRLRDCPRWVKRAGLQWAHRLAQEPRRLGRRYLQSHPAFVWQITMQMLKLRRYPNFICAEPDMDTSSAPCAGPRS